MTSALTHELRNVQNPAFGAALLWRFTVGFTEAHKKADCPVLPLGFLVLPIILHQDTFEILRLTQIRSGLHGFADKFARTEVARSDLLLGIHTRARALRQVSLESLQSAVRHSLLTVSPENATIIPLTSTNATGISASLRPLLSGAEKLGAWFSALSPFEICSTLKVAF